MATATVTVTATTYNKVPNKRKEETYRLRCFHGYKHIFYFIMCKTIDRKDENEEKHGGQQGKKH